MRNASGSWNTSTETDTGMHADGFYKFLHKHCMDIIKPANILHIGDSVFKFGFQFR